MIRISTVTLIGESPEAHGVGEAPTEIRRKILCSVHSIGQREAYLAMGAGLDPEVKLRIAMESDYHGEKLCEFEGVRYRIIRTYIPEENGVELVVQRCSRNARGEAEGVAVSE